MAKRDRSEITPDESPSDEDMTSKIVAPVESPEVGIEKLPEELGQVVGSSTEGETAAPKLATDVDTEVATREESIADAFWALLSRAGYEVW